MSDEWNDHENSDNDDIATDDEENNGTCINRDLDKDDNFKNETLAPLLPPPNLILMTLLLMIIILLENNNCDISMFVAHSLPIIV